MAITDPDRNTEQGQPEEDPRWDEWDDALVRFVSARELMVLCAFLSVAPVSYNISWEMEEVTVRMTSPPDAPADVVLPAIFWYGDGTGFQNIFLLPKSVTPDTEESYKLFGALLHAPIMRPVPGSNLWEPTAETHAAATNPWPLPARPPGPEPPASALPCTWHNSRRALRSFRAFTTRLAVAARGPRVIVEPAPTEDQADDDHAT